MLAMLVMIVRSVSIVSNVCIVCNSKIEKKKSLYELLPPQRKRTLPDRGHNYILSYVTTERFKRTYINR